MSRKLEPQSKYLKKIEVVLNCAPFVLICADNDFLENPKLRPKLIKTLFFLLEPQVIIIAKQMVVLGRSKYTLFCAGHKNSKNLKIFKKKK